MEIKKKLTQKNCYIGQNKPNWIVIHETDNTAKGASAARHAQAVVNGNLATSVHYFVDDKEIWQTLNHEDGAYAVGTGYGTPLVKGVNNKNSINIEICVNPDSNYETARLNAVWLVKELMEETGILAERVIRHYDAKRKWYPRIMLDKPELWEDFKRRISELLKAKWIQVPDGRWWYCHNDGSYTKDDWELIHNRWYLFDTDGYMRTGLVTKNGETYYLCEDKTLVEGACMVTDERGKLKIWEV